MLMLSVMSSKIGSTDGFYIQQNDLSHGSAQPLSRFFLAHIDSRGYQLRYVNVDDVCKILETGHGGLIWLSCL